MSASHGHREGFIRQCPAPDGQQAVQASRWPEAPGAAGLGLTAPLTRPAMPRPLADLWPSVCTAALPLSPAPALPRRPAHADPGQGWGCLTAGQPGQARNEAVGVHRRAFSAPTDPVLPEAQGSPQTPAPACDPHLPAPCPSQTQGGLRARVPCLLTGSPPPGRGHWSLEIMGWPPELSPGKRYSQMARGPAAQGGARRPRRGLALGAAPATGSRAQGVCRGAWRVRVPGHEAATYHPGGCADAGRRAGGCAWAHAQPPPRAPLQSPPVPTLVLPT